MPPGQSAIQKTKRSLTLLAFGAIAAFFVGEAGRWSWLAELFSHFVFFYAIIFVIGTWAANRLWQKALFAAAAAGLSLWLLWPVSSHEEKSVPSPRYFVAYNVFLNNERIDENIDWLTHSNADVLFLTEATSEWQRALLPLAALYPYGCSSYEDSPFGLALLARDPLTRCEVKSPPGDAARYRYIRAEFADGSVLYGIHPPPPIGGELARARNDTLEYLATQIGSETADVIVLGDMNTTPFSIHFRRFVDRSALRLITPRWRPTWIPGLLPLDLILVRGSRSAVETGAGSWMGSDHRPVWVKW